MAAADLSAAILADHPKAYWKMQEDGVTRVNPVDSSGNGLDMTDRGAGGFISYNQAGWAILGDKMILCPGGSSLRRGGVVTSVRANFTMEIVVQVQIVGSDNQVLIYNGNSGANGWGLMIRSGTHKIQPLLGGVAGLSNTNTALNVGTSDWYHIVFVKRNSGTAPEVWIDGVKDTAAQGTNTPNTPSGTTGTGVNQNTACQAGYSHYAIYETDLSSARIAAHYAALQIPGTSIKTVMGVSYPTNVKTAIGLAQASVKTIDGLS